MSKLTNKMDKVIAEENNRQTLLLKAYMLSSGASALQVACGEKPLFDYEKLLYNALLIQGFLNSDPKFRSNNPENVNIPSKKNISGLRRLLD